MLDAPELAKRLRAAMDMREPPLPSVELARLMGVSKQVVYEWRTTGRIGKGRLLDLAASTEMPLEFYLEPERGMSAGTKAIWRRLGKAFAKAAMIMLLAIPPLLPSKAEAAFNINIAHFMHCVTRWLRRWGLAVPIVKIS
jgi:hypothetical protein